MKTRHLIKVEEESEMERNIIETFPIERDHNEHKINVNVIGF